MRIITLEEHFASPAFFNGPARFVKERAEKIGGRCYVDDAGTPNRVAGIVVDISPRKRAEAEIKRVVERLTEAQRIGRIGDWEWDIATDRITWSPEVY